MIIKKAVKNNSRTEIEFDDDNLMLLIVDEIKLSKLYIKQGIFNDQFKLLVKKAKKYIKEQGFKFKRNISSRAVDVVVYEKDGERLHLVKSYYYDMNGISEVYNTAWY